MKFIKFIIQLIVRLFFKGKQPIKTFVEPTVKPVFEDDTEPVGVRSIHIVELCYLLVQSSLQREISKATIASIIEFSILPRHLINPLSYVLAIDAAYRFGMHHTFFPSRELFPCKDEQQNFISPYITYSGIDRNVVNVYKIKLKQYNGYRVIIPKDVIELDGVRKGYLGNLPNVSVPKKLATKIILSPVDPNTTKLWVNKWAKGLGQAEKYPEGYGSFTGLYHSGYDLNLPLDKDAGHIVYAISDGIVTNSVFQRNGLGNTVRYKILFNNVELFVRCAHLKDRWVKHGDVLKAGEAIGTIGNTSGTRTKWSNHLHFDVQKAGADVYEKTGFLTVEDLFRKFINLKELYPYG